MSTSNPFEPPRTTDLDDVGPGVVTKAARAPSEESLLELIATASWVRWLARVMSLSIAVGLVGLVADLVSNGTVGAKTASLFTVGIATALSTAVLVIVRRYASASERLRAGDRRAAGDVIDAQAAYFKLSGVLMIIALGLIIGLFLLGAILGALVSRK
jgi:hypothetical protein